MVYMSSVESHFAQLVPANAFKTLFLLLTLRTRGSPESAILIIGPVLACAGSGVNKVTDDFGADINSESACKNRYISVK